MMAINLVSMVFNQFSERSKQGVLRGDWATLILDQCNFENATLATDFVLSHLLDCKCNGLKGRGIRQWINIPHDKFQAIWYKHIC